MTDTMGVHSRNYASIILYDNKDRSIAEVVHNINEIDTLNFILFQCMKVYLTYKLPPNRGENAFHVVLIPSI